MVILFMIMESILISVYSLKLISFMHAKMGLIKDRNDMNLTEAEDIKKRKNTQKNSTKKILMTQIS